MHSPLITSHMRTPKSEQCIYLIKRFDWSFFQKEFKHYTKMFYTGKAISFKDSGSLAQLKIPFITYAQVYPLLFLFD